VAWSGASWVAWREEHYDSWPGVWLGLHKKGGTVTALTYADALDEALLELAEVRDRASVDVDADAGGVADRHQAHGERGAGEGAENVHPLHRGTRHEGLARGAGGRLPHAAHTQAPLGPRTAARDRPSPPLSISMVSGRT